MKIRVGHLYPDYLNIYADRGNIAVLRQRAARRGHELEVTDIGVGEDVRAGEIDLYYVGGGQDREQALIAPDIAAKGPALAEAVAGGAAFLAVCGGYQLLGRFYRDRTGAELPGCGLLPLHTLAGERRMIGDVLLQCEWAGQTLAGFENHAGRTYLDAGAEPLGRVLAGFGNDGAERLRGLQGRARGRHVPPRSPPPAQSLVRRLDPRRSRRAPTGRAARLRAAQRRARAAGARRLRRARSLARRPL